MCGLAVLLDDGRAMSVKPHFDAERAEKDAFLRATSPGFCSVVFFWASCLRVRASAPRRWTRFADLVTWPLPWWAEGWLGIGSWDEGEGCREVYFTRSLYWDSAVRTRSSVTFVLYSHEVTCETPSAISLVPFHSLIQLPFPNTDTANTATPLLKTSPPAPTAPPGPSS